MRLGLTVNQGVMDFPSGEQQHNYHPPGIISTNFDTNRIPLESILSYGKNALLGFILRGRSPTLYKDSVPMKHSHCAGRNPADRQNNITSHVTTGPQILTANING